MSPSLKLIVAVCQNRGIGFQNSLPWTLKKEMKYFAKMTKHVSTPEKTNAIIMGRKTWESIQCRALPQRINVVLTSKPDLLSPKVPEGVLVYGDFNEAIEQLKKNQKIENIWVVGGTSLYESAMNHPAIDQLLITEIQSDFECDVFFPEYKNNFKSTDDHGMTDLIPKEKQTENGIDYYYRVYVKK